MFSLKGTKMSQINCQPCIFSYPTFFQYETGGVKVMVIAAGSTDEEKPMFPMQSENAPDVQRRRNSESAKEAFEVRTHSDLVDYLLFGKRSSAMTQKQETFLNLLEIKMQFGEQRIFV
jgi:hypothetical protein